MSPEPLSKAAIDLEGPDGTVTKLRLWQKFLDDGQDERGTDVAELALSFVQRHRLSVEGLTPQHIRQNAVIQKQAAIMAIESAKSLLQRLSQRNRVSFDEAEAVALMRNVEKLLLAGEYTVTMGDLLNHAHNMRLMTGYLWPAEHFGERYMIWRGIRWLWGIEYAVVMSRRWLNHRLEELLAIGKRFDTKVHGDDDDVAQLRHFIKYSLYVSPVRFDVLGLERMWLLRKMSTRVVPLLIALSPLLRSGWGMMMPKNQLDYAEDVFNLHKAIHSLICGVGLSIGFSWLGIHLGAVDQARFYAAACKTLSALRIELNALGRK